MLGTLRRVRLEQDRIRSFFVRIGGSAPALAHGTCYVVLGRHEVEVMPAYGMRVVTVLIGSGEHAGRIGSYADDGLHETLSEELLEL